MQIIILKTTEVGDQLAQRLSKGGASEIFLLDPRKSESCVHPYRADILILADPEAVDLLPQAEKLISVETIFVLVNGNRPSVWRLPEAISLDHVLKLYFDNSFAEFSFSHSKSHIWLCRIEQHLSICLLRSGMISTKCSRSNVTTFAADRTAAAKGNSPSPSRSWAEMFLPACALGLPCDDCGRCH